MSLLLTATSITIFIIITLLTLSNIAKYWTNLSSFFHKNYTYFELMFIVIYSSQQIIFSILVYTYKEHAEIIVGLFALTFITIVSIEKLLMNSRVRKINEIKNNYCQSNYELVQKYKEILKEYNYLKKKYSTLLKEIKKSKKGR